MRITFTKLFTSITDSTVWQLPDRARLTWITMLAMADRRGRVMASVPGLAHRARVEVGDVEAALETFLAADPYSRTRDHDGRRIEAIDGGWRLLNYEKHRNARDDDERRDQNREAQQRRRERVNRVSKNADVSRGQPESAHAEAEAEVEAESASSSTSLNVEREGHPAGAPPQPHPPSKERGNPKKSPSSKKVPPPSLDEVRFFWSGSGLAGDPAAFWNYWESFGWARHGSPVKNWRAAARSWSGREGAHGAPAAAPAKSSRYAYLDEGDR